MSTDTQVAQALRVITVVSTKGGTMKKLEQNLETKVVTIKENGKDNKDFPMNDLITNWGVLKDILSKEGYDLSKLVAVESTNKHTLQHLDAALPEGDFRLFLRPAQTKSGATDFSNMGFGDMRNNYIKNDENAKKFLSSFKDGKNWTQLTTSELREGLTAYQSQNGEVVEINALGKVNLAQSLLESAFSDLEERFNVIQDEMVSIKAILKEYYDADAEVVIDRKEREEIEREMRELEEGL